MQLRQKMSRRISQNALSCLTANGFPNFVTNLPAVKLRRRCLRQTSVAAARACADANVVIKRSADLFADNSDEWVALPSSMQRHNALNLRS
jgi:hypothetical protein